MAAEDIGLDPVAKQRLNLDIKAFIGLGLTSLLAACSAGEGPHEARNANIDTERQAVVQPAPLSVIEQSQTQIPSAPNTDIVANPVGSDATSMKPQSPSPKPASHPTEKPTTPTSVITYEDTGYGTPSNETPINIFADMSLQPTSSPELTDKNKAQIEKATTILNGYKEVLESGGSLDGVMAINGWDFTFACTDGQKLPVPNPLYLSVDGVSFIAAFERETVPNPDAGKPSYTGKYTPRLAGNGADCSVTDPTKSSERVASGFVRFDNVHVSQGGDAYVIGHPSNPSDPSNPPYSILATS